MSLSMNSIVGFTGNKTMKLKGKIKGTEVLNLIDSEASHNFVSTNIVGALKILIDRTVGLWCKWVMSTM